MNSFIYQRKIANYTARNLLGALKQALDKGGKPLHHRRAKAIETLLHCHTVGDKFKSDDLTELTSSLNSRLKGVRVKSEGKACCLTLVYSADLIRAMAEMFLRYLDCFAQDPTLSKNSPIAICRECQKMFVRKKTHQRFCSDKCRGAVWRRMKKQKDVHYFARKAKSARDAKKAMKKARQSQ
jgi:hypothetical protein